MSDYYDHELINRRRNALSTELLLRRLRKYHGQFVYPVPAIIVANPLVEHYKREIAEARRIERRNVLRRLAACVSPVKRVAVAVSHEFEISLDDVMGGSRKYALPRQVAMYLARTHVDKNERQIANIFGKDHTCIRLAQRKIPALAATNSRLAGRITAIETLLKVA